MIRKLSFIIALSGAALLLASCGGGSSAAVSGTVTTIAGDYSATFKDEDGNAISSVDGTGASATFYCLLDLATDGTTIYGAESYGRKIRTVAISSAEVSTLAGSGTSAYTDGMGTGAEFSYPMAVALDSARGCLWVADNDRLRKVVLSSGTVSTVLSSLGMSYSIYGAYGITLVGSTLYMTSYSTNQIFKMTIDGTGAVSTPTAFAGVSNMSGTTKTGDGTGTTDAYFGGPWGITNDGTYLYVTDNLTHNIRRIEIDTTKVTTIAGTGSLGSANGTGTEASFNYPKGITTDGTCLYIADYSNRLIRRLELSNSTVTTFAGGGSSNMDGVGTDASFNSPQGITTDGSRLFVTDYAGLILRQIIL